MLKTRDSKERFDVDLANRLARFIQDSAAEPPTLDDMSAEFNVSPFHLQRTFKRVVGITPRQYADYNRLQDLKCRLREGEKSVLHLDPCGLKAHQRRDLEKLRVV